MKNCTPKIKLRILMPLGAPLKIFFLWHETIVKSMAYFFLNH